MNSWAFLTVMVFASFIVGTALSANIGEEDTHDYLYTKAQSFEQMNDDIEAAAYDTAHAQNEYDIDKTAGNKMRVSVNWLTAINYAFNPWAVQAPDNFFESIFINVYMLFKSFLYAYAGMLVFFIFINKKHT